mmetsp:Transcript_9120/g.21025  ORF Transcript_9120/g.21025 Transcript_9120/m.21025 type:complete len:156 (-) Transcript_9120:73-540(-)
MRILWPVFVDGSRSWHWEKTSSCGCDNKFINPRSICVKANPFTKNNWSKNLNHIYDNNENTRQQKQQRGKENKNMTSLPREEKKRQKGSWNVPTQPFLVPFWNEQSLMILSLRSSGFQESVVQSMGAMNGVWVVAVPVVFPRGSPHGEPVSPRQY